MPQKIAPDLMQSDGIADGVRASPNIHWRWRLASAGKRECSRCSGRRRQEMRSKAASRRSRRRVSTWEEIECFRG
ncbi:hypothetical protein MPL3365_60165 [Mesorhizobium plurifarium]|uniref:Uncharacterized protein n=1 Tax=Mesorhizobium plurifarium TaxID=69974 RepID=A0A090GBK8_MESPL|nr:hypothetical protein MPL3365_60165 [Mesorhizobium plurifarium]